MNYSKYTIVQLKTFLRERNLGVTGNKAVLVERLENYGRKAAEAAEARKQKEEQERDQQAKQQIRAFIKDIEARYYNPYTVPGYFYRYKFRAECLADVAEIFKRGPFEQSLVHFKTMPDHGFPDVEAVFTSAFSIETVRTIMAQVPNGHIMWQSLNYAEKYTGSRYFDASLKQQVEK